MSKAVSSSPHAFGENNSAVKRTRNSPKGVERCNKSETEMYRSPLLVSWRRTSRANLPFEISQMENENKGPSEVNHKAALKKIAASK